MLSKSSQRSVSEIFDASNAAPIDGCCYPNGESRGRRTRGGGSRHPNGGSRRSNAAKDAAVSALVAAEVVTLSAEVAEADATPVAVLIVAEVAAPVVTEIVKLMRPKMPPTPRLLRQRS